MSQTWFQLYRSFAFTHVWGESACR